MMVWLWLAEKARVPVCCHSQRSRHDHVECVGLLCGGERCDWMRVVKEKRRGRAKMRMSGKSIQKRF